MKRICVFCGSNKGTNEAYADAARRMGAVLVDRGLGLVYGGGAVGLMGIIADAVLERGGEVIGVIPDSLFAKEVGHAGLTQLHLVRTMHERKALMADYADGFIAMPGGFGTLDEFCEIVTWAQLGLHRKPCGMLNVEGYFDPFLGLVDTAIRDGFIRSEHKGLMLVEREPDALLDAFHRFHSPDLPKWIDRREV